MEIATRRQPTRAKITESGSAPPAKLAPITMVMATAAAGAMWVIDWKSTSRSPMAPRASWFPGERDPGEAKGDDESITTLPFRGIPDYALRTALGAKSVTEPRVHGAIAWNWMDRWVLLYDRDCGFCRWATRQLLAWDRRGR